MFPAAPLKSVAAFRLVRVAYVGGREGRMCNVLKSDQFPAMYICGTEVCGLIRELCSPCKTSPGGLPLASAQELGAVHQRSTCSHTGQRRTTSMRYRSAHQFDYVYVYATTSLRHARELLPR